MNQGYKTLKFFNRKKQEVILQDIDLKMGLQEVREHVIDGETLHLPSDDKAPGKLLNGDDKSLNMDNEIDQEEVANLLDDAEKHSRPQEVIPVEDEV